MPSSSFKVQKSAHETVVSYTQGFWTFSVSSLLSLFATGMLCLCLFLILSDTPFAAGGPNEESQVSFIFGKILPLVGLGLWVLHRYFRGPKWRVEISRDDPRGIVVRYRAGQIVKPNRLSMTIRSTAEGKPESEAENPGYWAEVEIAGAEQQPICITTAMGFPWTADREGSALESILASELNLQSRLERALPSGYKSK